MSRHPFVRSFLVAVLVAGAAGAWSCGPPEGSRTAGPEAETGAAAQAAEREWSWLQETRKELDRRRQALAANGADPKLARETESLALEFNRRLVDLINANPPVQGEPASERQQAAIRMKSDEEIVLARQFIEHGGDYQRAVDIYREALAVDPENTRLRDELARAQARRYMSAATFAKVKEGMTPDEVRSLLGQPNLHNVRQYPDRGVTGWFYPKDPSGAAAAVWFHVEKGEATVYRLDFNVLSPKTPESPEPPPSGAAEASPA